MPQSYYFWCVLYWIRIATHWRLLKIILLTAVCCQSAADFIKHDIWKIKNKIEIQSKTEVLLKKVLIKNAQAFTKVKYKKIANISSPLHLALSTSSSRYWSDTTSSVDLNNSLLLLRRWSHSPWIIERSVQRGLLTEMMVERIWEWNFVFTLIL